MDVACQTPRPRFQSRIRAGIGGIRGPVQDAALPVSSIGWDGSPVFTPFFM
jgi:hypothetical protein